MRYVLLCLLSFSCLLIHSQNVLISEDFNECSLPDGWTINLIGDGPPSYTFTDDTEPLNSNFDGSTIDGTCMVIMDDDGAGQSVDPVITQFISPVFDATVNSNIRLSVDLHFRHYEESALRVKIFDGNEFIEILELSGYDGETGQQPADFFTFTADLSFYANTEMQVMIEYDDGDTWAWWAGFDNVEVIGTGTATNLILEDFNDCQLPAGWLVNTITGENDWQFGFVENDNTGSNSINGTCFAYFDDDGIGQDAPFSTTTLISPEFDGTQFANFYVDFDVILRRYEELENLTIGVFDGQEFKAAVSYFANLGGPDFDEFVHETIDLSQFRAPQMRVVFVYDDGDTWGWWVGLDNIKISGEGAINDLCENAFDIELNQACLEGNNLTALYIGEESPCSNGESVGALWYRYEAAVSGLVEIKTNADFNDLVTVFKGSCADMTEELCDNWDEYGFVGETTEFEAEAGETYLIRINGLEGDFGNDRGSVCVQLEQLSILPEMPSNNSCENAIQMILEGDCLVGDNYHASMTGPVPSLNTKSRADIWYTFEATTNNIFEILTSADFSDVITLYSGDCGNLEEISSNHFGQRLEIGGLTIGDNYYVQVSGNFATVEGNVCMELKEVNNPPPPNDDCVDAVSLTLGVDCVTVNNIGANYSGLKPSCEVYPVGDIWFEFVAPASGSVRVNTGADFVHSVGVYQGNCGDLEEIHCYNNPLACDGFVSVGGLTPNETYLIQIASATDIFESTAGGEMCISILDGLIDPPAPLSLEVIVNCIADGQGQLSVIASGGTGEYTFQGNTDGEILTTDQTYLVVVTDENGCEQAINGTINCGIQNCAMTVNVSSTDISCNAANNGTASVEVLNPIGNATYLWSNGSTNASIENLSAGGYSVTVTDEGGCLAVAALTIEEPSMLFAEASSTNETSFDANDGMVSAEPEGGTPPYIFSWSNGSTASTQSGLTPGVYTVTVTDANECASEETVEVLAFGCALSATISSENVTCNGLNNGFASVSIEGGVAPYNYEWSNGASTANNEDLAPGNYTVTIIDDNNCPLSLEVTISQPEPLIANAEASAETSNSANDGTATATPSGGTGPYEYLWSNGEETASIFNLTPGNYTVLITDANDCTIEETVTVSAFNCFMTAEVTVLIDISCNGETDGLLGVSALQGTAPFNYELSNGTTQNTGTFTQLEAGNYSVTVTDASNCSFIVNATLTEPPVLQSSILNITNTDCIENAVGSATVQASGGTEPYNFAWSNGSFGATQENLAAGVYLVAIVDANECQSFTEVEIEVEDNDNPIVSTQNLILEIGESGIIEITEEDIDNGSTDNCGIAEISLDQTSFDCSDLGENEVVLTVIDVNSNENSAPATVTIIDNVAPEIDCPSDIVSTNCDGIVLYDMPVVTDNCTPGTPVLIDGYLSGEVFPEGETEVTWVVTDFTGNTATCSFLVSISNPLASEVVIEKPTCAGLMDGTATIIVNGGDGNYTYQWDDENQQTSMTATNLPAGTYSVTVMDDQGCSVITTAVVTEPSAISFVLNAVEDESETGLEDGAINVSVEGGTPPYSFEWTLNGESFSEELILENIPGGDYQLNITDANGCVFQSDIITVQTIVGVKDLSISTGTIELFPNPTSGKITVDIQLNQSMEVELTLFDVVGKALIKSEKQQLMERQFNLDLSEFAKGVYTLKAQVGEEVWIEKVVLN